MYSIKNLSNNTETYSDSIVEIFLHPNGSYVRAREGDTAEGFCAKIPTVYERPIRDDEGNETGETETIETLADTVFVFEGQTMKGGEPVGSYEEVPAVPVITELEGDLEQAYELLYG